MRDNDIDINFSETSFVNTSKFLIYFEFWVFTLFFTLFFTQVFVTILFFFKKSFFSFNFFFKVNLYLILSQLLLLLLILVFNDSYTINFNFQSKNIFFKTELINLSLNTLILKFLITVYLISYAVILFQLFYITNEFWKERFVVTLNFFIISMLFAILSSNIFLFFFSWECLGITSFCLITFFKSKISCFKSGQKANIFNKISDIFVLLSLVYFFNLNQTSIEYKFYFSYSNTEYIVVLLILASLIKSAQFFFYIWLPDSMDAPTPASALIHSATLVSIGFLLLLKYKNLIELFYLPNYILLIFSSVTLLFSSFIANQQTDIKKLLAYSTISNCAFIYLLIGLKLYELASLYFMLHGVFKSLSFIIAGNFIIFNKHNQDIRTWVFDKTSFYLGIIIFVFVLFSLSAFPFSLLFFFKNKIIHGFFYSSFIFNLITITLLIYTVNTYFYTHKIITFFFLKINFLKNKKQFTFNNNNFFLINTYVFYIVILSLLLFFFFKTNFFFLNWHTFFFFNFYLFFLFLNLILVDFKFSKLNWFFLFFFKILFFCLLILL